MDEVNKFIYGLGAMAEALGVFRDCRIENGFTRDEALAMCVTFLEAAFGRKEGAE